MLLPGESLRINRLASGVAQPVASLLGDVEQDDASWHFLTILIRHLPVDAYEVPMETKAAIATPAGNYEVLLKGDLRSVSKTLSVVTSRLAWFVGAMLLALLLAWLVIEIAIISRIKVLSQRADTVAEKVKGTRGFSESDLADLRGEDESGVLATCLHDLLRRVREDIEREGIRAEQERDMWHAVGHEVMSPLQSLMVLHGSGDDQSQRYINRMQQAIRVLYRSASPSEAFQSTVLQVSEIDLAASWNTWRRMPRAPVLSMCVLAVRQNRCWCGRTNIRWKMWWTHVLRNADRYRVPDTPIIVSLEPANPARQSRYAIRDPISRTRCCTRYLNTVSRTSRNQGQTAAADRVCSRPRHIWPK